MSADAPTGQADIAEIVRQMCLVAIGPDSVERSYIAVGPVALEVDCGQLIVVMERVWRTTDGINEVRGPDACDRGDIAVDVTAILVRCLATSGGPRGGPTSTETLTAQYGAAMTDADRIWNAMDGELPGQLWEKIALSQSAADITGGAVAIETSFSVGLGVGAWCQ